MDNKEKVNVYLSKIKKLRDTIKQESRNLTALESEQLDGWVSALDLFDVESRSPVITRVIDKIDPQNPMGNPPAETRAASKPGLHFRSANQTKRYEDLFGNDVATAKEWRDESISFFGAVLSGRHHPDLQTRAMSEGIPSDGGFAVPTEWAREIHDVSLESEIVQPRSSVIPMSSSEIHLPGFEIGDHSSSLYGGFTASYAAEAATLTEANPKVRDMILHANKLTGFLKGSNELVNDMIGGQREIARIAGNGLSWYRDKSFLKGSGAGEPLGILNSGCVVEVAKEAGQAASTIVYENLTKMMAAMWSGSFSNSVWVCHQSTIPQLLTLSVAVGTGGSHIPVLQESSGEFKILTRPVFFTEKVEPLGTAGDILLADFSQYAVGLRQGMRFALSQHVYFSTDQWAARLIERHDGQPLWDAALILEDGSTEVSPFVILAARA
ncbi:phage major capsid protein [Desulfosarcina sp.]|nr:phage major capsid protein [Desulfosarcina sp.]